MEQFAENSKNIWCTLVMLKEEYARGAAVVAMTLRTVRTKYPIWCMVTEDISEECADFLRSQFDNVVRVPLITHEVAEMKSRKQQQIYGAWIHASFTKWNIMSSELFPADKVILVDADMLFLENCDDLFDVRAPAATFSSPWAAPYMQPRGAYNPYGEMMHGQVVDRRKIRSGFSRGILCCACMVLVQPKESTYKLMLEILQSAKKYGTSRCISGFDEQLLVETWLATREPIHHIHQRYNWIVGKTNWLLNNEAPKTQQYYNGKPWHGVTTPEDRKTIVDMGEWEDIRDWWRIVDMILEKTPDTAKWFYPGAGK